MTQGFASERGFTRLPTGGGLSMQSFVGDGTTQAIDTTPGAGLYMLFLDSGPDHAYIEIPDAASASGYHITAYAVTYGNRMDIRCPSTGQFVGTADPNKFEFSVDNAGQGHSVVLACDGNYWYVVSVW